MVQAKTVMEAHLSRMMLRCLSNHVLLLWSIVKDGSLSVLSYVLADNRFCAFVSQDKTFISHPTPPARPKTAAPGCR